MYSDFIRVTVWVVYIPYTAYNSWRITLDTHQRVHCRSLSDRICLRCHSGIYTCSHSPTEPSPRKESSCFHCRYDHLLVAPRSPSLRGPPLRPDPPTSSSGHEQHVNRSGLPYITLHKQTTEALGISQTSWNRGHSTSCNCVSLHPPRPPYRAEKQASFPANSWADTT